MLIICNLITLWTSCNLRTWRTNGWLHNVANCLDPLECQWLNQGSNAHMTWWNLWISVDHHWRWLKTTGAKKRWGVLRCLEGFLGPSHCFWDLHTAKFHGSRASAESTIYQYLGCILRKLSYRMISDTCSHPSLPSSIIQPLLVASRGYETAVLYPKCWFWWRILRISQVDSYINIKYMY